MRSEELKPVRCGCGGKAYVYRCTSDIHRPWSVMCPDCEIITKQYNTERSAVNAWNKAMGAFGRGEFWEDEDEDA